MADLSKLHNLLDWSLEQGSHNFPGPNGGTCINEMAVVVAGFEYREINNVNDFPPCFSISLGKLLLCLNDRLDNDDARQKLKRFVLRLPGSADSGDVDGNRLRLIGGTVRAMLRRERRPALWPWSAEDPRQDALTYIMDVVDPLQNCGPASLADLISCINTHVPDLFDEALDTIDKAFDIGNRASDLDAELIQQRLAAAKQGRNIPTLVSTET